MDGPSPVAGNQPIQVSDCSLKRQYAREARAYWGEDSRQEVIVHADAAAITLGMALCRGSLVRITGIKGKVKVHETDFILTVRGVEVCSNAVVQEPILEWYAQRAALVAEIAGTRGGGALKDKQYKQATYAQTQLGGIIPPIGTDVQRRLNQLKQTV